MKITIFANGVSNGGAEHVACNLANYFVTNGYNVDLLTMSDDEPTYEISESVKRVCLLCKDERKGFVHNLLTRIKRFDSYIRESDTDCYIAFFLIAQIWMNAVRKKINVPVITAERTNPYKYPWYYKILLRYYAPNADMNVFQTSGQREFLGKRIRDDRCTVIPNASECKSKIYEWERRDNIIVSAGRLHDVKNYSLLIEAFSKLDKNYNYRLIIYGEGKERKKLEKQIENLHLEDKVSLPGRRDNIDDYLRKCKIFAMTSKYEGMPNALIEAMSLGLACISTDCPTGGPKDLISPGKNGVLISVDDKRALVDALNLLISDEKYAKQMGENALYVREKYSSDKIFKLWNDCVKKCVVSVK